MNPTALLFAGQGAQFVGMAADLAAADPEVAALFDRANDVLGFDLKRLCFEGPIEELTRSNVCQPAVFTVGAACHAALRKRLPGASFAVAAGLSLGEWTALHAAGVLSFEDALRALEARGRFMQEACEAAPGGMLTLLGALTEEQLDAICAKSGMTVANRNSQQQTVLSGLKEQIPAAEAFAKELGARTVVLNVAGAFHSPLMEPARAKLAPVLEGIPFRAPAFPVLSNVTGAPHGAPETIRETMLRQVVEGVHWLDGMRWCLANGISQCVELGPGKVLAGLALRIDPAFRAASVQDLPSLDKALAALA
ncbi:MAG: ACP S-malonyltransferase [Kiritimatiellia bacterium]|jgi:[acyl-carrier-protein] S-malonyltransferase